MLRYFDKTFFKFLFGFLAILAVSLIILLLTKYAGQKNQILPPESSYVEARQGTTNQ